MTLETLLSFLILDFSNLVVLITEDLVSALV